RLLYKKMMESYDALNDQPNRRKYQKLYLDLEAKINDEQQNIAIHETEQKYNVQEKDKKISSLQEFKDKFYKNRLIFGVLLLLVFLLALYSFVRWKKVDYYKKKLQSEKLQVQEEKQVIEEVHLKTVEELEKVKKIVTEGHIILKDNTKVYLADLMYVKAEDHYLNLYSKDGKKHFVRGKISDILNELPPNFLKCHRSYIVNTNYINTYGKGAVILKNKEKIPVSRNFKF
ncbi:MAG: LytR/AlgR family response regulator transcription factor, partial [Flavobacterium sp.]